jgi:hypothetical protein
MVKDTTVIKRASFDKVIDNFTKLDFPIDVNHIYLKKGCFKSH